MIDGVRIRMLNRLFALAAILPAVIVLWSLVWQAPAV